MTNRIAHLKSVEESLSDNELVYVIGRRLLRDRNFVLALSAVNNAGSVGWDEGYERAKSEGVAAGAGAAEKPADPSIFGWFDGRPDGSWLMLHRDGAFSAVVLATSDGSQAEYFGQDGRDSLDPLKFVVSAVDLGRFTGVEASRVLLDFQTGALDSIVIARRGDLWELTGGALATTA